jgi:CDP-diacylglycerol--serine O-phosphatidyltransferase
MRKIAILPTMMTLGNAVCGFASIVFASRIQMSETDQGDDHNFAVSASLILGAMLFDVLDGYVARLSRTASKFGGELDSLSDAISFGAAPAFLLLRLSREWGAESVMGNATKVIAILFMVCVLLRLARFNVENDPDPASHKRFKGLPSPAGAGCIVSLAILRSHSTSDWTPGLDFSVINTIVKFWAPFGGLIVALLMVSRASYPHMTKQLLRGQRRYTYLLRIILVLALLALARELSLLILFWGYALTFAIRYLINLARRQQAEQPMAGATPNNGLAPPSESGKQEAPTPH